jgi:predicted transcriptional regulator
MKSKKIRKTITMSKEVEDKLKKMAKILHTNQSELIESLVDEASSAFLELYENAKEKGLYASSLKVISKQLEKIADDFELKGGNNE